MAFTAAQLSLAPAPFPGVRMASVVPGSTSKRSQARNLNALSANDPQSTIDNFSSFDDWDSLLAAFPEATAFHTAAWGRALAAAYGFKPCYLAIGPTDAPHALLPLMEVQSFVGGTRAVSLPFTDFCPPLIRQGPARSHADPGSSESIDGLKGPDVGFRPSDFFRISDFGLRISSHWRSIELRGASANLTSQIPALTSYESFYTHDLDLTVGGETLLKRFSQNARRNIVKGKQSGVQVRQDSSESALRTFFALQCRTRRKHGLPPQPFRFFEAIHAHVLSKNLGTIYLAEQGGKAIAAALFLHHGKSVIYKYGASDERHLDTGANHLIMAAAIADYATAGFATFNFGRTELSNSGLRRYKLGFGALENRLDYHRFDYRMNAFVQARNSKLLRIAQPIFRQLPLPVSRLAGALLYRHAA